MNEIRLFVAAFAHETNSFSPIKTTRENFESAILVRPELEPEKNPEELFVGYSDFVQIARSRGHHCIPGIVAWAQPSGPNAQAEHEALREELLDGLRKAMPVNMVLLMLHGAQMAESYDDCEGDLLQRVRDIVGPDVPIGVELDLHCNISDMMIHNSDVIIACKEYPHTDFDQRAVELYNIIEKTLRGDVKPVMAYCRIPMLSKFHTTVEPMRSFVDKVQQMEDGENVLSITLAHGFPWSDALATGSGVLVVTNNDKAMAEQLAKSIAVEFYELRNEVTSNYLCIEDALDKAVHARVAGPVVIADTSDNAGGGAPSDSTFLLHEMLKRGIKNAAVAMIWDPVSVQQAMAAGIGGTVILNIGGKYGVCSGEPVCTVAEVLSIQESSEQQGLDPRNKEPLGPSVAVRVDGIDIVINSIRQQVFSPECFSNFGIELSNKAIVVVKSSQHFYDQFEPIAGQILYCDAPGTLSNDMSSLPFQKLQRPIWPLDEVSFS